MKTYDLIAEIKREFNINGDLAESDFADTVNSANDRAIDSTAEAFDIGQYNGVEFWEDGVTGIEDEKLRTKINQYYFKTFEELLRLKITQ